MCDLLNRNLTCILLLKSKHKLRWKNYMRVNPQDTASSILKHLFFLLQQLSLIYASCNLKQETLV